MTPIAMRTTICSKRNNSSEPMLPGRPRAELRHAGQHRLLPEVHQRRHEVVRTPADEPKDKHQRKQGKCQQQGRDRVA